MATLDFDDYDSILSSLHNNQIQSNNNDQQNFQSSVPVKQENRPLELNNLYKTTSQLSDHLQHQDSQRQQGSRFSSISHNSQLDSEINFNEMNDAMSSLSSSILSPYSSGSSPDDFFLNNQQQHQQQDFNDDSQNATFSNPMMMNSQPHYVPMGESMSTSTVTFNNQYLYDNNNTNKNNNINSNSTNNSNLDNNNVPPLSNSVSTDSTPSSGSSTQQQQQQQQQQQSLINHQQHKSSLSRVSSIAEVSEDDISSVKSRTGKRSMANLKTKSADNSGVSKPGRKIKSSHNLIEKKYRTNINSKIIELRNCVPALRIVISKNRGHRTSSVTNEGGEEQFDDDDDYEGNGYTDDEEKLDGLKPAKKLNKATILSKATEYIRHLEYKNDTLLEENAKLRSLVENANSSLESILINQQPQQMQQTAPMFYRHDSSNSSSPFSNGPSPNNVSPRNTFSMDRHMSPHSQSQNIQQQQQQQIQQQQQQQIQQQQQNMQASQTSQNDQHSTLASKLMMGGMACLLGSSSFDDFSGVSGANGSNRRGLFSIPVFAFHTSSSSTSFNSNLLRPFMGLFKLMISVFVLYQYILLPIIGSFEISVANENGKVSTATTRKQLSFFEVCEKLFSVTIDPISFYKNMTYTSVENVQEFVVKSLISPNLIPSPTFYIIAFKALNLESTSYNNFLKALLFRRISEINKQRSNETGSNTLSLCSFLINKLLINRFGTMFWRVAKIRLDSDEDSNVLINLLSNYSYKEVDCSLLLSHLQEEDFEDFAELVTISLVDKLLNTAMTKMISLEALNKKLIDVEKNVESDDESLDIDADIDEAGNILNYEDKDKLSLAITSLRIQINDLLQTSIQSSNHISGKHLCRCLVLQFMIKPSKDHLRKCFKFLKQTDENEVDSDLKVGLVCCVLKYQLIHCQDTEINYEQLLKWLNKLKLPNFTNNYVSGSALRLFEFVALFNVFNLLSVDLVEHLHHYSLEQKEREQLQQQQQQYHNDFVSESDITAKDFSSDGDYEEDDEREDEEEDDDATKTYDTDVIINKQIITGKPAISRLDFKLLNILANMRIFIGNSKHDKELCLGLNLQDYLIEGFIAFIEKLNGF